MHGIGEKYNIVSLYHPVAADGGTASDKLNMKGWENCDIVITSGVAAGTMAITLDKDTAVGGSGATALAFTTYYVTGIKVPVKSRNDIAFSAAETITATGGLSATFREDIGSHILMTDWNGTTIVDAETMTGGTSGATGVIIGAYEYEDVLIKMTAASNTFNVTATNNQTYIIPISAAMMGDGYDVLEIDMADPSSGTVITSVHAVLTGVRYKGYPTFISGIYD